MKNFRALNRFGISVLGLLIFCSVQSGAIAAEDFKPDEKVVYKTVGDTELELHIFKPADHKATDTRPAIVFFFGGGWNGGTPKQFYEQARFFADKGIVAISADYRVKSKHKVTPMECVADGKSAIRYVRSHAKELGIDPEKIVAAGGSAGGHVAACTGTIEGLDEETEDDSVSSVPNAMMLYNPVLDTGPDGFGSKRFPKETPLVASPVHHIKAGIVPTIVFHGTADKTVPFEQAKRFTKLMTDAGNRCELCAYEGKGHGFFNGTFFRKALKEAPDFAPILKQSEDFLVSLGYIEASTDAEPDAKAETETEPTSAPISKPNIVIIYTDDQGYGDVSALNPNAKFQTPNMDRIAKEGVSFTNGHSADSVCTPSRYALLTGRYPWRTRMKLGVLGSEAKCLITDDRMTIPSLLRDHGYHTGMVGKWHLGMDFPGKKGNRDWTKPVLDMPLDKGFDYFYGIPASLNFGILAWFEGRHAAVPPTMYTAKKKNPRHSDYRIMPPYDATPEATRERLQKGGFEIAEDFVDDQCLTRFTDKAIQWIDGKVADAKNGKPFFLYLPYTSPHFPVCPLPEFQGKGECGAYGEFLIETDHHIGRVLDHLESAGISDNTMVIFTSDNGPEKPWVAHLKKYGHDSRGGYREGKRSVYEGGHRVPFLVRWPKGIDDPGRSYDGLVGQIDLLATVADVIGAEVPVNAGEDSESFANVFKDGDASLERAPKISHGNSGLSRYAITDGNWKLVMPGEKHPKFELYDLASDMAEQNTLADTNSDRIKSMTAQINQLIARGRTTAGDAQANDTGYWKDLHWISEQEYTNLVEISDASKKVTQPQN